MGTYERSESLEIAALGNKIIYVQNKSEENIDQYYLEGSENEGWKVNIEIVYWYHNSRLNWVNEK